MTSPRWPRYAAAAFGLLWFVQLCGASTLNPMNTEWMFTGDWRQHWLGFLFFQREPWTFPLGGLPSLLYPTGTNIGFTDSNPLLSIVVKPFAGFLPWEYQLIGWWLAGCFVLQGYAGAALASAITKDAGQQMLGGFLFVLSPVLMLRLGHDTLCAQWVILALLYLGLREFPDVSEARRAPLVITAVVIFAAAVHPYLAAMTFVLALAALLRFWRARLLTVPRTALWMAVSTAGLLATWGAIGYFGRTPDGSGDFGRYRADLLALFDPTDHSRLVPQLRPFAGDWEGIGFLGVGGLVALGLAIVALVRRRPSWRRGTFITIAACAVLCVYAWSSSIAFGGEELLNVAWLYEPVMGLVKPFRSSGRFIWPMHYLVLAFGIWGATRIAGRDRTQAGTLLLAAVVIVQASDVRFDRWWLARKAERQISMANFAPLRGHYQHLALAPAQVFGACGDARYPEDYVYRFMLLAHRLGLTFNSGIYARLDVKRVQAACETQNQGIGRGVLDPRTIYVASDSEIDRFKAAGVAACGRWDGHWICVSRASNPRFATYIETGKDPGGP
jgi:hypothetical protein